VPQNGKSRDIALLHGGQMSREHLRQEQVMTLAIVKQISDIAF